MYQPDFITEMLNELAEKEAKMQVAHADMVLKEISDLTGEIEHILAQADEERKIIVEWALQRSAKLQTKIDWLTGKLEAFMNEQDPSLRTIDLAHGKLLKRKQIEKLVVEDLELFMKNSNLNQLTSTQPEVIKPDLTKIKNFYKMSGKIAQGCTLVESTDKFSIKLKNGGIDGTAQNGAGSQQTNED